MNNTYIYVGNTFEQCTVTTVMAITVQVNSNTSTAIQNKKTEEKININNNSYKNPFIPLTHLKCTWYYWAGGGGGEYTQFLFNSIHKFQILNTNTYAYTHFGGTCLCQFLHNV